MKKIAKPNKLNEMQFGVAGGAGDPTLAGTQYNVQGSYPGYVYSVLGFNDALQQKPNNPSNEYYIHPGSRVRGAGFNNPDKRYTGIVNRIVKNENGEIICLYIIAEKTSKMVTIRADENLELLINKDNDQRGGIHTISPTHLDLSNRG